MKLFLKAAVIALGLLLILLGFGGVLVTLGSDATLKPAAAFALSQALTTEVVVGGARISPHTSTVELRDVSVASLPPFKDVALFDCGRIIAQFEPLTLLSKEPTVKCLVFHNATVRLRHRVGFGSNLRSLTERVKEQQAPKDKPPGAIDAASRLVVKNVRGESARLELGSNAVPGPPLVVRVPAFTVTSDASGVVMTSADIALLFIESVLSQALESNDIARPLSAVLKGVKKELADWAVD